MEASVQHGFGGDDVDARQARQAQQQIEVGGPQAVGVGDLIGHRDHHVSDRVGCWRGREGVAQPVLVEHARRGKRGFIAAKHRHEVPRLRDQAQRAAIDLRPGRERADQNPFEIIHPAAVAADPVVERQHVAEQPGADGERRHDAAADGLLRRALHDGLAFQAGQQRLHDAGPSVQLLVETVPRQEVRQQERLRTRTELQALEGAAELAGGVSRGHEHGAALCRERIAGGAEVEKGTVTRAQVWDAREADVACRRHGSTGGRRRREMSSRARSSSRRAPAAAADASHACCMLPDATAVRRKRTALAASCTALVATA